MDKKYSVFLMLLIFCVNGYAQEKQLFVPSGALQTEKDSDTYCTLISNKSNDEINRKVIYNLASNGVIARTIESNNLKYTKTRYNHMLLKLFWDSYLHCESFSPNYFYVFDARNIDNQTLVAQHKMFLATLLRNIQTDKNSMISKLANAKTKVLGYLKYKNGVKYSLSFYKFLPVHGPLDPTDYTNRVASYELSLNDGELILDSKDEDLETLKSVINVRAILPPPPPSVPK